MATVTNKQAASASAALKAAKKAGFDEESRAALKAFGYDDETVDSMAAALKSGFDEESVKAAKPVVLEGDPEYTLEFSRASVCQAEDEGFEFDSLNSGKGMARVFVYAELFRHAFKMHHPEITTEDADRIFDEICVDKEALVKRLMQLFMKPMVVLMDANEKNGTRKVRM
jgi:hypothetical protein